jgi:hypothetical protein
MATNNNASLESHQHWRYNNRDFGNNDDEIDGTTTKFQSPYHKTGQQLYLYHNYDRDIVGDTKTPTNSRLLTFIF